MSEFSIKLRKLLQAKGMSTKQAAKAAHASQSDIIEWAKGKSTPTASQCELLQRTLGVKRDSLWQMCKPFPMTAVSAYRQNDKDRAVQEMIDGDPSLVQKLDKAYEKLQYIREVQQAAAECARESKKAEMAQVREENKRQKREMLDRIARQSAERAKNASVKPLDAPVSVPVDDVKEDATMPISPAREPQNAPIAAPVAPASNVSDKPRFSLSRVVTTYSYTVNLSACNAHVSSDSEYIELDGIEGNNSISGFVSYDAIPAMIEDLEWLLQHKGTCPA